MNNPKVESALDLFDDIMMHQRRLMGMMGEYLTSITNWEWTARSIDSYAFYYLTLDEHLLYVFECRLGTDSCTFNIHCETIDEEDAYNLSEEEFLLEVKKRVKLRAFV